MISHTTLEGGGSAADLPRRRRVPHAHSHARTEQGERAGGAQRPEDGSQLRSTSSETLSRCAILCWNY